MPLRWNLEMDSRVLLLPQLAGGNVQHSFLVTIGIAMAGVSFGCCALANPASGRDELLIILRETGSSREGIPVYERRPDSADVDSVLSCGLSGRLLRLYRLEQQFLHGRGGPPPEPAYLLLSRNQGGFPRVGFFLGDQDKRHVGYVDLHERSSLSGRFGSMDQIFPHELAHVILRQLIGEPHVPALTQVHAIGVTTDPVTAFQEGFAEHMQILAIDDPDAVVATRALASEARSWEKTRNQVDEYRRELTARWAPATRRRITFPLWFGGAEQAMRYHAVKANLFSFEVLLPSRLLRRGRLDHAYLLQSILPGTPAAGPKRAARALACEGAVAAFFSRWSTHEGLRQHWQDDAIYSRFGVSPAVLEPWQNLYLKLFVVLADHAPPDTRALVDAYRDEFPEEAAWIDDLVVETFHTGALPSAMSLWIRNRNFSLGTSLYDQFRSLPRPHVFDLNAASLVDLLAFPGIDLPMARSLRDAAPFDNLEALPGTSPSVQQHLQSAALSTAASPEVLEDLEWNLDLRRILISFLRRALLFLSLAAFLGALLHRLVGRGRWGVSSLKGVAVAVFGLGAAWIIAAPPAIVALVLPTLLFGFPETLWRLIRRGQGGRAIRALVAWFVACTPAALLVQPLF